MTPSRFSERENFDFIWKLVFWKTKVIFGNIFCFLFSKTCFWEYKEKINFLYF